MEETRAQKEQPSGRRKLRFVGITAPDAQPAGKMLPDGTEDRSNMVTAEEHLASVIVRWEKDCDTVLVLPAGSKLLALDSETGQILWSIA